MAISNDLNANLTKSFEKDCKESVILESDSWQSRSTLEKAQKKLLQGTVDTKIRPQFQPRTRLDIPRAGRTAFKKTNTSLLFHGTRSVNVTAILRESLRLPETLVAVPRTGAKFGPGIYFSDDWKKSADYTNAKGAAEVQGGSVRGRKAFMFLTDVVLGTIHLAPELHGYTKPPRGFHSVFGKAGHSGVDDNEYIIYHKDRSRLRYLIEFKTYRLQVNTLNHIK